MQTNSLRTAIVLTPSLQFGEAANAAAICMGNLSLTLPDLYDGQPLKGIDGAPHASIRHNVVILKATGSQQLSNQALRILRETDLALCLFTQWGRAVSEGFQTYAEHIAVSKLDALEPVALAVAGDATSVREMTKKFSFYR